MFNRILIANRGEIAVRIARAARELGIETIAIYHLLDKASPYVQYADFAYQIVGNDPRSAYLDANQIIEIAQLMKADAIHPGYGFLSENAEFARECQNKNIKFIGPSANSIDMMGSKTRARQLMQQAGIPVVPGTFIKIDSNEELYEEARKIGYPVLLKASSGGGGKGMRKVYSEHQLLSEFESASREALKSFGSADIYIEKYIENPKHIEIQIIGDEHGNMVHLAERDCSIQRRHQKLIEEAPSTVLNDELREKMGQTAIQAAKACDYYNAGTIEFLFDRDSNFYFLEMNTRLQVEHPVTEMITGIDLAKEQILVAAGRKLSFSQDNIKINGHAIECRINAEDPFNDFMPDTGTVSYLRQPGGYGVRVDSGIETGSEITMHFDPMLAKLIVWGTDRLDALSRMERALKNFYIKGIKTSIPFHIAMVQHPEFRYGHFDTGFIEHAFDFASLEKMKHEQDELVAALAAFGYRLYNNKKDDPVKPKSNKWKESQLLLRKMI